MVHVKSNTVNNYKSMVLKNMMSEYSFDDVYRSWNKCFLKGVSTKISNRFSIPNKNRIWGVSSVVF